MSDEKWLSGSESGEPELIVILCVGCWRPQDGNASGVALDVGRMPPEDRVQSICPRLEGESDDNIVYANLRPFSRPRQVRYELAD